MSFQVEIQCIQRHCSTTNWII